MIIRPNEVLTHLMPMTQASDVSFNNFAVDGATDAAEFIFQVGEAITITRLGVRVGAVVGTSPTYRISLQGVSAAGVPDGTVKASGNASATWQPSGAGFSWRTLTSSYAASAGEFLALVVDYSSGTIDASNYASITTTMTNLVPNPPRFPTAYNNAAGTRSGQGTGFVGPFGFGTSGQAYGIPIDAAYNQVYNSGSGSDEWGMRFSIPTHFGSSCQLLGAYIAGFGSQTGSTIALTAYNGTTSIASLNIDSDMFPNTSTGTSTFRFASPPTISPGTQYRLALAPVSTQNTTLRGYSFASAADRLALVPGSDWLVSHRADAGAWSDVDTSVLPIIPIIGNISSGGGGALRPQFSLSGIGAF